MRILITGSREYTDHAHAVAMLNYALQWLRDMYQRPTLMPQTVTVVHGDARGADRTLARAARELGFRVEAHPAQWDTYGKRAGIMRNNDMVRLGANCCLAFPLTGSKGTWHCMNQAKRAGIPVLQCTML